MDLLPYQRDLVQQVTSARKAVLVSLAPGTGITTTALAAAAHAAEQDGAPILTVLAPKFLHAHVHHTMTELGLTVRTECVSPELAVRNPGAIIGASHLAAIGTSHGFGPGSASRRHLKAAVEQATFAVVATDNTDGAPRGGFWHAGRRVPERTVEPLRTVLGTIECEVVIGPTHEAATDELDAAELSE